MQYTVRTRSDDDAQSREGQKEDGKLILPLPGPCQDPGWFPQAVRAARKLTNWPLRLTNPIRNSNVGHTLVFQALEVLVLCCSHQNYLCLFHSEDPTSSEE